MLHVLPLHFDSKDKFHAYLVEKHRKMDGKLKKRMARTGATIKETVVEPVPQWGSRRITRIRPCSC